jgi:hypothetical protein
MITKLRLLILFLIAFSSLKATVFCYPLKDTSQIPQTHSLNRQQFLTNYGTDDTSSALINYWFGRRSASKYMSIVGTVTVGLGTISLNSVKSDSLGGLFSKGVFALAIVTGVIILLLSFTRFLLFSRKKLLRALKDYHNGKPLSKKLKNKISNRLKQKAD